MTNHEQRLLRLALSLASPADQIITPCPLFHGVSRDYPWPRAYHLVPRFGALAARISGDMAEIQGTVRRTPLATAFPSDQFSAA